ncbi:MAG: hypothetical protein KDB53_00770 [Planctomycetes bacterium]|nr:hypothetical protein [Planctomycetota bacterium]
MSQVSTQKNSTQATADLVEQIEILKRDLANLKSAGATAAREKLHDAGRAAKDAYVDGKDRALGLEDDLESAIRSSPLKSVLIAAGFGLAFGLLGRR